MEATKSELFRLGVFVIVCVTLIIGILGFYLGKHLTNEKVVYFTRFSESVDGLVAGANVKWNGVIVGKVISLEIDDANLQEVVVQFEVKKGTPIKASVIANLIGGFSITGFKTIELTGGTSNEPILLENHEVKAGTSQMKQMSGQAEALVLKLEVLLNNTLELSGVENQKNTRASLENVNVITQQIKNAQIGNTMGGLRKTLDGIDIMVANTNKLLSNSQENIALTFRQMKDASQNFDDFTNRIKENPSLLLRSEPKQGRSN